MKFLMHRASNYEKCWEIDVVDLNELLILVRKHSEGQEGGLIIEKVPDWWGERRNPNHLEFVLLIYDDYLE